MGHAAIALGLPSTGLPRPPVHDDGVHTRSEDRTRARSAQAMFDDNWFVHQGDNFSIKQLCDATAGVTARPPLSPKPVAPRRLTTNGLRPTGSLLC